MTSKTYLACFPIIFSSAKRGEFMAFRLGLTGGIACGKSTASKAFLALFKKWFLLKLGILLKTLSVSESSESSLMGVASSSVVGSVYI